MIFEIRTTYFWPRPISYDNILVVGTSRLGLGYDPEPKLCLNCSLRNDQLAIPEAIKFLRATTICESCSQRTVSPLPPSPPNAVIIKMIVQTRLLHCEGIFL